jgi:hypothetical protein
MGVPDGVPDRGRTGVPDGGARRGPDGVPDGVPDGWPDGAGLGARRGPDEVPDGWPDGVAKRDGQTGCPTGPDECLVIGQVILECHVIGHIIFECHVTRLGWQGVILLPTLIS